MSYAWDITHFPPPIDLETTAVLKQVAVAHRYVAELKGVGAGIPSEEILVNTLTLQEARESSEIENIVTTQDELFQADPEKNTFANAASKEVHLYAVALQEGFTNVRSKGLITLNDIVTIQKKLIGNDAGLRKVPGTVLKNSRGAVIYTPPQDALQVEALMHNLVRHLNEDDLYAADPLVKMAVLHHQFESIHPFYDGNGRTGRIVNVLYLVLQKLLNLPTLYLSRYIMTNRPGYYQTLQRVHDGSDWEPYLLYMLKGIEQTAKESIEIIEGIRQGMNTLKNRMQAEAPKIYSQDLVNLLYRHPYTKIEYLERELGVSRITATRYLEQLTALQIVDKQQRGRFNYYINRQLVEILRH